MKLITITGPSGAGKDTVAQMLSDMGGYKVICSYTTRPKREGEIDGWQHYFVEKCDVPHDKMLAYTQYGGYEYWTTIDQVTDKAIYVIDEDGLKALCEKFPDIELFKICVTAWEATRLRRWVSQERLDRDQQHRRAEHTLLQFRKKRRRTDSTSALARRRQSMAALCVWPCMPSMRVGLQPTSEGGIEAAGRTRCSASRHLYRCGIYLHAF